MGALGSCHVVTMTKDCEHKTKQQYGGSENIFELEVEMGHTGNISASTSN